LPGRWRAPVAVGIRERVFGEDITRLPQLRKIELEFDRNGKVDATGLPVCKRSLLEARSPADSLRICRASVVGTGSASIAIESIEQDPLALTVFNGGVKDGTTTLFIQSSFAPDPTPIVVPVKVRRIDRSRYGWEATAAVPPIAEGRGSLLAFSLKIERLFVYRDTKRSYVEARCPDRHLDARMANAFSDGTFLGGTVVRACTPTNPAPASGS
jgi:hypothetical protein